MCKFFEMLRKRWVAGARVCIGLDSQYERLPASLLKEHGSSAQVAFNHEIVKATKDFALAYKPNYAFYCGDAAGNFRDEMQTSLLETIRNIHDFAPSVPVILDAKRGDIGNTNNGYVTEAFHAFGADALTVSPYFGMEAMKPFLEQKDKGIIVLCKTSNPGAAEFQDVTLVANDPPNRSMQMYKFVAHRVAERWNYNNNCALVVGATYPEELGEVRRIVGDMFLLVPGIGTQGGDVEKVLHNGLNGQGSGLIINSSSGIIFASSDADYAEAAKRATLKLTNQIDAILGRIANERV